MACPDGTVNVVSIADHVARSLIPRKCFRDLTRNPFGGWICCDVDPDQVSAVQTDNDNRIEQVEADHRDNEQIHGSDVRCLVTQKNAPSLAWWPASVDHVLGDA